MINILIFFFTLFAIFLKKLYKNVFLFEISRKNKNKLFIHYFKSLISCFASIQIKTAIIEQEEFELTLFLK